MADFARHGPLHEALRAIVDMAEADFSLYPNVPCPPHALTDVPDLARMVAICCEAPNARLAMADQAIRHLIEHTTHREIAVSDLANQLCVSYEELNMTYNFLQAMATKLTEREIGEALVTQTAETLGCRRVSLMLLDESEENLRLIAAVGLPKEAENAVIPLKASVAGKVATETGPVFIHDICRRPDLAELSRGTYETGTFAVIRVALRAQSQFVGLLSVTERNDRGDFTARDCKLLETLSAIGAAGMMHCRLQRLIHEQMMGTIRALAFAVDAKDHYTHAHSHRVSHFCLAAARGMGITDREALRKIELTGLLHDIGKIAVPDAILLKVTNLTQKEAGLIRSHVRVGAQIVGSVKGLEDVADAILHHHERYDGRGYPDGLSKEAIPLASRMVTVADTFDAMTSDRPYRKALPLPMAFDEIIKCQGTQLDPAVTAALIRALPDASAHGAVAR